MITKIAETGRMAHLIYRRRRTAVPRALAKARSDFHKAPHSRARHNHFVLRRTHCIDSRPHYEYKAHNCSKVGRTQHSNALLRPSPRMARVKYQYPVYRRATPDRNIIQEL